MRKYAIIGKPIGHSFSPKYFTAKFSKDNIEASYEAIEIDDLAQIRLKIGSEKLDGFNVTIPFKQDIIKYLDYLDPIAAEINAVNTVQIINDKWYGYNTDWIGFKKSIQGELNADTSALIFGTGGSNMAVKYALKMLGVSYNVVSRTNQLASLTYADLPDEFLINTQLLINCTPLGMHPKIESCVDINYECLTQNHLCYDLVYNPEMTLFLRKSKNQGAKVINGLKMLELQAEAAWGIWNL